MPHEQGSFPALDDEPPPAPWRRRLAVPAAVIVVAALAVGAAVLLRPASHAPAKSGSHLGNVPGRIVALDQGQDIVVSDPGGSHLVKVGALNQVGQSVTRALDNKYLSLGDGLIVATGGRQPAMARTKISPFANGMMGTFDDEPFADHDGELLAMVQNNAGPYTANMISAISLTTGRSVSLGIADGAAGDPKAPGAFVSVGANVPAAATSNNQTIPDIRIELRDAGRPVIRLATAAALNRAVGQSRSQRVLLTPFPSPSGNEVAVTVEPVSSGDMGIVVLSRAGRVVGAVPTLAGAIDGPAWSPDGASLAFPVLDQDKVGLSIWKPGGRRRTQTFPRQTGYYGCLWSPDETRILCAASFSKNPNAVLRHWVIAKASGGDMAQVTGPGSPLAWLP